MHRFALPELGDRYECVMQVLDFAMSKLYATKIDEPLPSNVLVGPLPAKLDASLGCDLRRPMDDGFIEMFGQIKEGEFIDAIIRVGELVSNKLSKLVDALNMNATVSTRLPLPLQQRGVEQWITDDFYELAMHRAAFGQVPCVLETVFAIYERGGFAFGWTGEISKPTLLAAYVL